MPQINVYIVIVVFYHVDKDVCTAVGWSAINELVSCSDDKTILKWNLNGEMNSKVGDLDSFVTDMHWFPSYNKRANPSAMSLFVVACVDGSFKLISGTGRIEKDIKEAHKGAIVCIRWSYEGTALVTAGEDGVLKIWLRSGQLRSTLTSTGMEIIKDNYLQAKASIRLLGVPPLNKCSLHRAKTW